MTREQRKQVKADHDLLMAKVTLPHILVCGGDVYALIDSVMSLSPSRTSRLVQYMATLAKPAY